MKVVCIILARGGSKGIKNKNTQPLGGKPLIQHTIEHALTCKHVSDVVVSTDCNVIKTIAETAGAIIPGMRPDELSTDTSTTESGLQHTIKELKNMDKQYDLVLYLDCCQPFRDTKWIDECIEHMHRDPALDSCFVAKKIYKNFWTKDQAKLYWEQYSSRQQRAYVLEECTGLCCVTKSNIIENGNRIGENVKIVPVEDAGIDIHTPADLELSNLLYKIKREERR